MATLYFPRNFGGPADPPRKRDAVAMGLAQPVGSNEYELAAIMGPIQYKSR